MKITILVDDVWNFNIKIANRLREKNHTVTFIDSSKIHFSYKNNFQRIANFFSKTFLNNNIKSSFLNTQLKEQINNLQHQDCALIINPDTFDSEIINLLKTKTKRYIAHNYDSLDRHPLPNNHAQLFDDIYSFDIKDVATYKNLTLLSNFIYTEDTFDVKTENKMFMILSHSKEREIILSKIADILDKKNIKNYEFIIVKPEINEELNKNIILTNKTYSLDEVIEKVKKAEILIDLVRENQSGLSFRFFEAMAFKKKIITNNQNVKLYNFYNPNNILIIEDNIIDIPENFLNNIYQDIPSNIYNQYTIDAWIKTAFKID